MATTSGEVSWLRSHAANGVRIVGLYTHVYAMAASGQLNSRRVTVH